MKIFITGVAGFIGSNLADRLLEQGHSIIGWDNFITGQIRFLEKAKRNPRFKLIIGDNLDISSLQSAMIGAEMVFHFAANADIKDGWMHPKKDLDQNTIATFNVLEAMRSNAVRKLVFSSTGSTYGEALVTAETPTGELAPFPIQTSLYAASKVACEGLITSYAEAGHLDEAYIFRFVSILGERYTHGHIFDFYKQLREHPDYLTVLGNGKQRKSYLYVNDCLDAIFCAIENASARNAKHHSQIYNLGTTEYIEVAESVKIISETLSLRPKLLFTGGERGWIGDNPFIFLDTQKIRSLGWLPKLSIRDSVVRTLKWIDENKWIYENRK